MAYVERFYTGGTLVGSTSQPPAATRFMKRYLAAGALWDIPPAYVFPVDYDEYDAKRECAARRYNRRRNNTVGAPYDFAAIAERDEHRCHLCGHKINMRLSGRHPEGPTIDHLIPVSQGGGDEPANVSLAHSRCNIKRGIGGAVQLRLIG